jgi:hypothetical protein
MNASKLFASIAVVLLAAFAAACSEAKPKHVPDVRGYRLDYAESVLEAQGLSYEIFGGGKLGVIDEDNWWVCAEKPLSGHWVTKVKLIVAKSCPETPRRKG